MTWAEEIARLRSWVVRELDKRFAIQFGWTRSARSSPYGETDQVETADGSANQRPVRRLEMWGLRGRQPKGVRTFWVRIGSSNVVYLGIAPPRAYGPGDLDDGETALYAATAALIRLWASGKVTIDADGDDVVVNGGTLKVARATDPTGSGKLTLHAYIASGNPVAELGWTPEGLTPSSQGAAPVAPTVSLGNWQPAAPANTQSPVEIAGKITDGAPHFKGQ